MAAGTAIAVGNPLYYDGVDVQPAGDFPFTTDVETTRRAFAKVFAGFALTDHVPGAAGTVVVAVREPSGRRIATDVHLEVWGQPIGPAAAGLALSNDTFTGVPFDEAIGRLADNPAGTPTSRVAVFASAFDPLSNNANSQISTRL